MKVAIMYDFDKTLCTKDMQEYTFIPSVNLSASDFWGKCDELSKKEKMDKILAYLYLMIKESKKHDMPIKKDTFNGAGKNIEFFPGVTTWFERINEYGKSKGIEIEHYIISSGLKEIIEGSQIAKEFKEIYACEFLYDVNGIAIWPKLVVNYTTKTQFLFRINKGVLDVSNDNDLNKYIINDDRRIPFRNMIYIADGITDIPCMKLVKANGGKSIAVYTDKSKALANSLLLEKRVDFIAPSNYEENSEIDIIMKRILDSLKAIDYVVDIHHKQLNK
ncbi:MAG: haloacid dehalogenase-like hydrolase [Acholeplasmatales bacterium]|nr:haloacid dehalogenase-like hydrolase [Acholeplasmatales bacterium]